MSFKFIYYITYKNQFFSTKSFLVAPNRSFSTFTGNFGRGFRLLVKQKVK